LPVSVNLSHHEFWDAGLLAHLDQAIHASGLETEALVLEITEGVVMQ
jgi:EAL domain-containing protein (putative c-di-GMP-specific phosphodiesterase class I)